MTCFEKYSNHAYSYCFTEKKMLTWWQYTYILKMNYWPLFFHQCTECDVISVLSELQNRKLDLLAKKNMFMVTTFAFQWGPNIWKRDYYDVWQCTFCISCSISCGNKLKLLNRCHMIAYQGHHHRAEKPLKSLHF